jgi:hypothetical protein
VDREGENPGRATKEASDRFPPFELPEARAVPQRVVGEQRRDPIGVVLLVAQRRVARFQIADRLRVLQRLKPPLQPFDPRRV